MGEDNNIEQSAEKKNNVKILAYIGLAVFLATVLVIALFAPGKQKAGIADTAASISAPPQVSASPKPSALINTENTQAPQDVREADDSPVAAPFIYEKGAYILMASGSSKINLGSRRSLYGCSKEINGVLSQDNRYLYYIEDTDINTGQGTLKRVSTDAASSIPVIIEEGVCAAQLSPTGDIMYIKNVKRTSGDLYVIKDGESSFAEKNVVPLYFTFSQDGKTISYIVQESAQTFALNVKKINGEPELVTRFTAEASIQGGVNLSRFNGAALFDSGQVLYSIEENYNMPLYFYDAGGKTERICNDGYIVKTYPDGGFLYAEIAKNNLWYKSPGAAAVSITQNYSYSRFPEDSNRFLLMEHIGDGLENSSVMIYEACENKEPKAISLGDDKIFEINAAFDCVVYEREGVLCASYKTDTGWMETKLLKASKDNTNIGSSKSCIVARFDGTGENLYFFDEYKCGPLYRFSLKDGKKEKLLDKTDGLYVYDSAVYAHVSSDRLYRISDKTEMISEDVRNVLDTREGAFLLFNGSFKYIAEGTQSAAQMDSFTRASEISGSIEYRAPLEEDVSAALEALMEEANYCLYKLGVYKGKTEAPLDVSVALALAQKLAGREDITAAERRIFEYMAEGLKAYHGNKRKAASSSLQKAADAYADYLNSAGSEEEK